MILHVLPGDSLLETFKATGIAGDVAVCREALVDGDLSGETLPDFWETRAKALIGADVESRDEYHENVVREFAKLTAMQSGSEINLWFEYELFCQVNMWFCLSLMKDSAADIFRVAPVIRSEADVWEGFGSMPPEDLRKCFSARGQMTSSDMQLGDELWNAFRNHDHADLDRLSKTESPAFPRLREVCQAAIEKDARPKLIVNEIVQEGETKFENVFREFRQRAGVYGYGDTQVKRIWQELFV